MRRIRLGERGAGGATWGGGLAAGLPMVSLRRAVRVQQRSLPALQAAAADAAAKAAAEEAGEDPDDLPPSWLSAAAWRVAAWCVLR